MRGNFYARVEIPKGGELSIFSEHAENDAHTELKIRQECAKLYDKIQTTVNDLRQIPAGILKFLNNQQLSDKNLLADFFSISAAPSKKKKKKPVPPTPPPPQPKNPSFSVTKDGGKLSISMTENDHIDVGARLAFEFAYKAAFSKSHFSQYSNFDFDLKPGRGMAIDCKGAEVTRSEQNNLELIIDELPTKISLNGFDDSYEVVVRMKKLGAA